MGTGFSRISSSKRQVGEHQGLRGRQIGKEYLWESTGRRESKNGEIVKLDQHPRRCGEGQNDQSTSVHTVFWLFRHLTPPAEENSPVRLLGVDTTIFLIASGSSANVTLGLLPACPLYAHNPEAWFPSGRLRDHVVGARLKT